MKILLDTNIIVHAYNKSSPNQQKAAQILKTAMQGKTETYITAQVLFEFFSVVTNPKRVEKPMTTQDAADLCLELWECTEIEKISQSTIAPIEIFKLAKKLELSKAKIFDCALAVTAKENDIEAVFTENISDFKNYEFIKAINPFE